MSELAVTHTPGDETAERHPGLEVVCRRLERILHGRAAENLLADPAGLPEGAGIVVLPAWSWLRSLIDLGRKDRAFKTKGEPVTEERLLMPVRNDWDLPLVTLVDGTGSVQASHRTRGLGHQFAGQTRLVRRPGHPHLAAPEETPTMGRPVFVGSGIRMRTLSALRRIAEDGTAARWELIQQFEPMVRKAVHVAHSAISHEIGRTAGIIQPMLDEQGIEQVVNLMMFGDREETGREKPGSVFRLIELCLQPDYFLKAEPFRVMNKHLRRDAEAEVRRKLGDPHIGPKVRAVALQHPRAELSAIVEEYRKVYPKDRLSEKRAQDALSVSPDAMARVTILTEDLIHPSRTMTGKALAA